MSLKSIADTVGQIGSISGNTGGILGSVRGLTDMLGITKSEAQQNFERQQKLMQQDFANQKELSRYQSLLGLQNSKDLTQFNNEQTLEMQRQSPLAQRQGLESAGLNVALLNGAPQTVGSTPANQSAPNGMLSSTLVDAYFKSKELAIQNKLADAQVAKTNAEISNINKDTDVKGATISLMSQQEAESYARTNNIDLNTDYGRTTFITRTLREGLITNTVAQQLQNLIAEEENIDSQTFLHYMEAIQAYSSSQNLDKQTSRYDEVVDSQIASNKANAMLALAQKWRIYYITPSEREEVIARTKEALSHADVYDKEAELYAEKIISARSEADIATIKAEYEKNIPAWYRTVNRVIDDAFDKFERGVGIYQSVKSVGFKGDMVDVARRNATTNETNAVTQQNNAVSNRMNADAHVSDVDERIAQGYYMRGPRVRNKRNRK